MGVPLTLKNPAMANVRKWRVKGFDNHLIFYEPRPDGVSIVRVLHGASDWLGLLCYAA
jgi:toxin ParE1/3/4